MVVIYILECTDNKYYVGKSVDTKHRINDHIIGKGSMWTSKYKPIKIMQIIENCDSFDEDKYTIVTMNRYGIDNVRGGSFARLVLSSAEKQILHKMINSSLDTCFNCGSYDHFINKCNINKIDNKLKIIQDNVIRLCKDIDNCNSIRIDIEQYIEILKLVEPIIFNNVTINDIFRFSGIENSLEPLINYYHITKNIIIKLNNIIKN
jgi:hypothetical protein